MIDERKLRDRLPIGWIGDGFQYHQTIASTNEEAARLADSGAPHGTLVLAESQTAGKGRGDRKWITVPGTALAFSLIIRPAILAADHWLRLLGLGALSVADALNKVGLNPEIKWPNDVLLDGKKTAGILLYSSWSGKEIEYSILGIGVNVLPGSVPDEMELDFPAVSVVEILEGPIERGELLISILSSLDELYEKIDTIEFIKEWQARLAYFNQKVMVREPQGEITGILTGLSQRGELKLTDPSGRETIIGYGDIKLRPTEI